MAKTKAWVIWWMTGSLAAVGVLVSLWLRPAQNHLALLELLPPDADLYAAMDWPSLRSNPAIEKLFSDPPGFHRDLEYERFVQGTGFRYQEELKQLAVAKVGEDWVGAARIEMDRPRLVRYLESRGLEITQEEGRTVYRFGTARPFRLALLEDGRVVFAVGANPELLRQALRQATESTADSGLAQLRRTHELQHLPKGSDLVMVGRIERLARPTGYQPQMGPFKFNEGLLKGSKTLYVAVGSGPLQLDIVAEALCDSAASAEGIAKTLQGILEILRAVPPQPSDPSNAEFGAFLAGVTVQQAQESVFVRWQGNLEMLSFLERLVP